MDVDLKSTVDHPVKKLFIETYGCQMNVADSEVVASVMQMAGYDMTESIEEADAIFVNTCSVRDNAEQKIYGRLQYFQSLRKKKKASDSRCVGLYGGTGQGGTDNPSSCGFGGRSGFLYGLTELDWGGRAGREGYQCGIVHPRNL